MTPDITVHHFNVTADAFSTSQTCLLEAAQFLVEAATSTSSQWRSVIPKAVTVASSKTSSRACFVWARAPPAIDRRTFASSRGSKLLDWDASFNDDHDILDVDLLPDFERAHSEEACFTPSKRKPRLGSPFSIRCFANAVDTNSERHPNKRLCNHSQPLPSAPAIISISKLIPFPHYYESPDPARPPPPGIDKIPAFRIARTFFPSISLTVPFARMAWLVPLRGVPPVEGASPAQIYELLSPHELTTKGAMPGIIQWTSAAVSQFWVFLLRQRDMNNFGPLALAYMFSPCFPMEGRQREPGVIHGKKTREADIRGGMKGKWGRDERHSKKPNLEEDRDEEDRPATWEYIKIYHDSRYAMKLRSLLDSFRWEDNLSGERERTTNDHASSPLRYRVLKSTRLVLVNETGIAILLA